MNVSISLLIIFGTVFLVGEHVLARTLETEERVAITLIPGKGTEAPELGLNGSKAEKRLQLEPA